MANSKDVVVTGVSTGTGLGTTKVLVSKGFRVFGSVRKVHNGQALLPMLELIEQSRMALDELIDVMARASIEAVLELSARQVAGSIRDWRRCSQSSGFSKHLP